MNRLDTERTKAESLSELARQLGSASPERAREIAEYMVNEYRAEPRTPEEVTVVSARREMADIVLRFLQSKTGKGARHLPVVNTEE